MVVSKNQFWNGSKSVISKSIFPILDCYTWYIDLHCIQLRFYHLIVYKFSYVLIEIQNLFKLLETGFKWWKSMRTSQKQIWGYLVICFIIADSWHFPRYANELEGLRNFFVHGKLWHNIPIIKHKNMRLDCFVMP